MKSVPRISDTEWEIMRIIWGRHPLTASEVVERLAAKDASWHPKTVRTLLARLVRKKALDYKTNGRAYVYSPLVSEAECVATASESFLERVFGGSLQPMLTHFVEHRKLTDAELEELRRLLDGNSKSKNTKRRRAHGYDTN
jgi:BlaI family transcriptional regulator, penicillinase repressor